MASYRSPGALVLALALLPALLGCRGDNVLFRTTVTLSSVTLPSGTSAGGTGVTLAGSGFASGIAGGTTVTFGGSSATGVAAVDDATILCTTPPGLAGSTVDVVVVNGNGAATLTGGFSYHAAPTLSSVAPSSGPPSGGTAVTLSGTGFAGSGAGPNAVTFAGVAATAVVVVDDTTITCDTPAGSADTDVDVVVANANGSAILAAGYHFDPPNPSDLDGDGTADLVVGAPRRDVAGIDDGAAYVFFGDGTGALVDRGAAAADIVLVPPAERSEFGKRTALGDVSGDGLADLVVSAHKDDTAAQDAGAVYVFFGPLSGPGPIPGSAADVILLGESLATKDEFGTGLALGDVDGDGTLDVLVGAPKNDAAGGSAGTAYVFLGGPSLASTTADLADVLITGELAGDELGSSLTAGDLDGDGTADLVVGARKSDAAGASSGAVYVFFGGAALAGGSASFADAILTGQVAGDEYGGSLAPGDVSGDGIGDLVVGARKSDLQGASSGAVYVHFGGPAFAGGSASTADVILDGEAAGDELGETVATGDVNGDGIPDLLAGAAKHDQVQTDDGRAYVFFGGPTLIDENAALADAIFTGEPVATDRFGAGVAIVDLNGDGIGDVFAAATRNDGAGADSGRVYVFFGGPTLTSTSATADDVTYTGQAAGDEFGTAMASGG